MRITKLIKRYWVIILILTLISYGQLLFMEPWQDDNALFFKLAHMNAPAGFLGKGFLGEGPYKYTATFYFPIYYLFQYNTFFYFALALGFYILSTLVVYLVFSKVLGKKQGQLAGFLYAAGYVASDGFIRLFNSVITSLSVILVSLLFFSYWKYYRLKRPLWYFLAILSFYLAAELARARTHYLISLIFLFELIFFFETRFKSVTKSLLRTLPFLYIYYHYFVINSDTRSSRVGEFTTSILKGEFDKTYGWLSSLTNVVFPDWSINLIYRFDNGLLSMVVIFSVCYLAAKFWYRKRLKLYLFLLILLILGIWYLVIKSLFMTALLNLSEKQIFVTYIGSLIPVVSLCFCRYVPNQSRKTYLFLVFWLIVSIGPYAAYQPTVSYETTNRLLSHSFLALVGIFGIVFVTKVRLFFLIGLFWGIGNLYHSILLQSQIVNQRSMPVKEFYQTLRSFVPQIDKGNVFYFDVADNSKQYFADAFSVAQMPETTAIAWRYGVDRYDLFRETQFVDVYKLLTENKLSIDKVNSFFYKDRTLVDTTVRLREYLKNKRTETEVNFNVQNTTSEWTIKPNEPVVSLVPIRFGLKVKGEISDLTKSTFPVMFDEKLKNNDISKDNMLRRLAFEYKSFKDELKNNGGVRTSSVWKQNEERYLIDGNISTLWQADRLLWGRKEEAVVTLDLGKPMEVDRLVWTNAYANNSPTIYKIESSLEGNSWTLLKEVSQRSRIESWQRQVISFQNTNAKFIKIRYIESLNNDSPGISEVWPVPTKFSKLNINSLEEFINSPFGYLPDKDSYLETLNALKYTGKIEIYYKNNKSEVWLKAENLNLELVYDAKSRMFSFILPAGGTEISDIKLVTKFPGMLQIETIFKKPLSLEELNEVTNNTQ